MKTPVAGSAPAGRCHADAVLTGALRRCEVIAAHRFEPFSIHRVFPPL